MRAPLLALALALPAQAQEVVADLSQASVSIDSTFAGQEILQLPSPSAVRGV